MASEVTGVAKDRPSAKTTVPRKQNETKRHRSIFDVEPQFFDSCRLLSSPDNTISGTGALDQSNSDEDVIGNNDDFDDHSNGHKVSGGGSQIMQRWSCGTCKAEFESLEDQRLHFKSDLHRFNIKLNIAGKSSIKEEDFDEATSDSLCKDYDVSSISGSEDEDERESSLSVDRQRQFGGISKNKIFIQLQDGEKISLWRCLLLNESENISFENDKSLVMGGSGEMLLTEKEVIEKLKYIIHEPRDNTRLRIVLLARGGHFAGCVFDGMSLVAHKTFHRYVVRAKAGKKQSSKDAGGRSIHSAGASLRRYNEFALKKDIQELFALWKPHFAAASCVFVYAPSSNRQLFFDGEKPYFICHHRAIRNIPLTVRRPTFKEARRIYILLVEIIPEITQEKALDTKEEPLSNTGHDSCTESRENLEGPKIADASPVAAAMDNLSISNESEKETLFGGTSTPLHEAAKSGNAEKVLELLEQSLDPCIKDERGQTPYMLASEKEVRNTFRRFMASNLDKWDWHAAKVPSPLTKEIEESQAAKQAEKDAKRKAKAKELKKLKKAKEKKAQAETAQSQNASSTSSNSGKGPVPTEKKHLHSSSSAISKEEELKRAQEAEREKRAAAAERRLAALKPQETRSATAPSTFQLSNNNATGSDILCSCCNVSLAGKVPFHRYHYKYCSTSCMHVHREFLEEEG